MSRNSKKYSFFQIKSLAMKELTEITQQQTMSSREIAELTGKNHQHVLRDVDVLNKSYEKLSLSKVGQGYYIADNGQKYRCYELTKMQTIDLMTGYSIELRIKINRRWEELENQSNFQIPTTLSGALRLAAEQADKIEEQQKQLEAQQPKVLFATAVETSDRSVLIAELAKIICQNGVDIGQNRLFTWMRNNGFLGKWGEYYNQPTQMAMGMGLFEIKKTSITKPDGSVLVNTTPKVTGKGQVYFVNKFLFNNQNNK